MSPAASSSLRNTSRPMRKTGMPASPNTAACTIKSMWADGASQYSGTTNRRMNDV